MAHRESMNRHDGERFLRDFVDQDAVDEYVSARILAPVPFVRVRLCVCVCVCVRRSGVRRTPDSTMCAYVSWISIVLGVLLFFMLTG